MADYDRVIKRSDIPNRDCTGTGSQISQALNEVAQGGSIVPPGVMAWWTGAASDIPSGGALMTGTSNSADNGGTGFNLVDRFVLAASSGAGTTAEGRTSREGHYHTISISEEDVTIEGEMEQRSTGLTSTDQAAYPEYTVTVGGGYGWTQYDGEHKHEAEPDSVTVILAQSGSHSHDVASTSMETITAHTATQVKDCIANHGNHTHGITTTYVQNVDSGSQKNKWTDVNTSVETSTLSHSAGSGTLTHTSHGHDVTMGDSSPSTHTHPVDPHYHEIEFSDDGSHLHKVLDHDHTVTFARENEHHTHPISESPHTHPLELIVDGHSHGGGTEIFGGEHDHAAGTPAHMKLMPIEKLNL